MIGIKQGQLAIIKHLVNRVELADKLDQVILLLRLFWTTDLRVHVPQGRYVNRIRNDGNGSLIELDRFRVSGLGFAHRGESRESPVVARIRSQGALISRLGVLQVADLEKLLPQLILAPGDVLTRHPNRHRGRDSAPHELDGALRVTEDKAQIGKPSVALIRKSALCVLRAGSLFESRAVGQR